MTGRLKLPPNELVRSVGLGSARMVGKLGTIAAWEPAVAAFSSKPEENEVFRSVTPIRTTTTLHDFLSIGVTTREAVPLPRGAPSVPLRRTQDLAGYGSRQRL